MKRISLVLMVLALMFVALPAMAQEVEEAVELPAFDLLWINATLAFFLPLIISAVKNSNWSTQLKRAVALIISAIVGVVTVGVSAGWDLDPFQDFIRLAIGSITQVWLVATVAYLAFWKDTGVEQAAEGLGSGPTTTRPESSTTT